MKHNHPGLHTLLSCTLAVCTIGMACVPAAAGRHVARRYKHRKVRVRVAVTHTAATRAGAASLRPRALISVDKAMAPGQTEIYEFEGITMMSVSDPAVADIVPISTRRLLVSAKSAGVTTVSVFDRNGKNTLRLNVAPLETDLNPVAARVQAAINLPDVTAHAVADTILLEGKVASPVEVRRAEAIAAAYSGKVKNLLFVEPVQPGRTLAETYAELLAGPLAAKGITVRIVDDRTIALTGSYTPANAPAVRLPSGGAQGRSTTGPLAAPSAPLAAPAAPAVTMDPLDRMLATLPSDLKVVNLVETRERAARQILVRTRIVDINRGALQNLGVNWGSLSAASGSTGAAFSSQPILFAQTSGGSAHGSVADNLLGGGPITRALPFAAQLNALITENKARVLSEPSLMVLDGNEANMLIGGEIPIPVAQTVGAGGTPTISIDYKPFGVRLSIFAAIQNNGDVQISLTPEVSNLDYSNAVQYSGFVIPALTVRRATSTLQMKDGEVLVIGGLYSSSTTRQTQRIPLLSQIPILGQFFRNSVTNKTESELVILLQPEIIKPDTAGVHPPLKDRLDGKPIEAPAPFRTPNMKGGADGSRGPEPQQQGRM